MTDTYEVEYTLPDAVSPNTIILEDKYQKRTIASGNSSYATGVVMDKKSPVKKMVADIKRSQVAGAFNAAETATISEALDKAINPDPESSDITEVDTYAYIKANYANDTVAAADKDKFENFMVDVCGENPELIFLDLRLFVNVKIRENGNETFNKTKQVHETGDDGVTVRITIPESLRGDGKTAVSYCMASEHNGVRRFVDVRENVDSNNEHWLEFKANKFSYYVLGRAKVKELESEPEKPKDDDPNKKPDGGGTGSGCSGGGGGGGAGGEEETETEETETEEPETENPLTPDKKEDTGLTKADERALQLNKGLKISQTGSKIKVQWSKVDGADGYIVYATYCGEKKYEQVATISGC